MRRFLIFFATFLLLIALSLNNEGLVNLQRTYQDGVYTFYVKGDYTGSLEGCEVIHDGTHMQITVPLSSAFKLKSRLKNIQGESVKISATKADVNKIIEYYQADIIGRQYTNGLEIIYAYSPVLPSSPVMIGNDYINMQIAIAKDYVTIGTPLILGAY